METPIFNCDICLFKTKSENRLNSHKQAKHVERIFKCYACDYTSSFNQKVNEHLRIKHRGEKLKCKLCSYVHDYKSDMSKHMKKEHRPKIVAQQQQSTCSMCDWKGTKQRLNPHKKSSHGEGHKCENCGKVFQRLDHLTKHNNAVHLGIKFPCDQCDYKATTPGSLRTHKRSLHEGQKVPCTQCEHKAFDIGSLSKHVKTVHLGEKSHACDKCNFKASSNSNLKAHIHRSHTLLVKSFKCAECSFTTTYNVYLTKHMNAHKEGMPFSCEKL